MHEPNELHRLEELRSHARTAGPRTRLVAITSAARRRQRRAAVLTSGVVAASVTAALFVVGGSASPDSLRTTTPAQPGGNQSSPVTAPGSGATTTRPGAAPAASRPATSTATNGTGSAPGPNPSASATPAPPRPHPPAPAVQRTYSGPGSQTVCGGIVDGTEHPDSTRYCGAMSATPDGHDIDFDIEATLDATSRASQFSFDTTQEIDIAVYRQGKLIWRWSSGQTFRHDPHSLPLQPGTSYDWTTTWHAVGPDGHPLPAGDYDVVGTVLATELGTSNSWTSSFSL